MANDSDWVADVRRWVAGSRSAGVAAVSEPSSAEVDLGYEAANPALMAQPWGDSAGEPVADRS